MEKPLEVSLCKEICLICGKEIDGPIVMNSILTQKLISILLSILPTTILHYLLKWSINYEIFKSLAKRHH